MGHFFRYTLLEMAPKVKKTVNKKKRRQGQIAAKLQAVSKVGGDHGPRREDAKKKGKRRRALVAALVASAQASGQSEDADAFNQRQAAEWKAMKAEVARLKKERQKLPTKGSKVEKVNTAQRIRMLLKEMQVRHEAERKAAGVEPLATSGNAVESSATMED